MEPVRGGVGELPPLPMDMMVPGIPGSLNLRHPDACQALLDDATAAGATRPRRHTHRAHAMARARPSRMRWTAKSRRCRPRSSSVRTDGTPRCASRSASHSSIRTRRLTSQVCSLTHSTVCPTSSTRSSPTPTASTLLFHQGNGRARAYLCVGDSAQKAFAGPEESGVSSMRWNDSAYPWGQGCRRRDAGRTVLDVPRRRHVDS